MGSLNPLAFTNFNFLLAQQAASLGNFPAGMFPFATTQQSHQPANFLFSTLASNTASVADEKTKLSQGFVSFPQTTSATARHS
jgi:hypothetical protein